MGNKKNSEEIIKLAEKKIIEFYDRRIEGIKELDIKSVVKRKNPYLYKALGFTSAKEIVQEILLAHSISSYEGIFGDAFFEPLAEEIGEGYVSEADGVDIIVQSENIYRAYAIKSGNSVFNASSKKNQNEAFQTLRGRIQKRNIAFDAVVGYGYGNRISNGRKSNFREISGQAFWEELSGKEDCYLDIAQFDLNIIAEKKKEFNDEFDKLVEKSIKEFEEIFCINGEIDWEGWIKYNSAVKCSKLNIKTSKKTIVQEDKIKLDIYVKMENEKEDTLTTENRELKIEFESPNIKIENNEISICNQIENDEEIKLVFSYRGKTKIVRIKIKPQPPIKCKKLTISMDKKVIKQEVKSRLNIRAFMSDEKEYEIITEDENLKIEFESPNIKIENNEISICNNIEDTEVVKITFIYFGKSKTLNLKIRK